MECGAKVSGGAAIPVSLDLRGGLPQSLQKQLRGPREYLILFPHDAEAGLQRGRKRLKAQAGPGCVEDFIQRDRIAESLVHQNGGVVQQAVRRDDV